MAMVDIFYFLRYTYMFENWKAKTFLFSNLWIISEKPKRK